jgi:isopentenyl phosphate kinase
MYFLKLGGSFITHKDQAYTARHAVIARMAQEVREALDADPDLRLLIGHGSGSFGHWAAQPYGTRQGVHTAEQWRGYTEVAAAAARLNRIVTDIFLKAGVPILSIQPSASARCQDGLLTNMDTHNIRAALGHHLVPLVYGDVAMDAVRGGTIASTEEIFLYLAEELHPTRLLLISNVPGVLDAEGNVIPHITPNTPSSLHELISGSEDTDVTGGMASKVTRMLKLVQRHPQTAVHILTAAEPGLLTRALLAQDIKTGTRITASPPHPD